MIKFKNKIRLMTCNECSYFKKERGCTCDTLPYTFYEFEFNSQKKDVCTDFKNKDKTCIWSLLNLNLYADIYPDND